MELPWFIGVKFRQSLQVFLIQHNQHTHLGRKQSEKIHTEKQLFSKLQYFFPIIRQVVSNDLIFEITEALSYN